MKLVETYIVKIENLLEIWKQSRFRFHENFSSLIEKSTSMSASIFPYFQITWIEQC